ncbi:hypothetical protein H072_1616 [Dactylellina haptotyla CBS 200.50]|uniref:Vacuolar protein sorting-associated protein 62 n=1 Tax=Dactylellina haptotyla (strain CBS 200.50) TaxID=1284197 RepID=S8ATX5_DACHA|nr:hypothetical protein H072_1616 [Dactylellina haptotyla CBS 200.50]
MPILSTTVFKASLLLASLLYSPVKVEAGVIKRGSYGPPPSVPQFVLDYAPLVYLHKDDSYRPSDIGSMLANTRPQVDYQHIQDAPTQITLDNLHKLNDHKDDGKAVYLTAVKDVSSDTEQQWLKGVLPDGSGYTKDAISAAVIVNEKDNDVTDVFYCYFYNFNAGPPIKILGIEAVFGNHVGDWEYNMVRFKNGEPQAIYYSQHAHGEAFTYGATRKRGRRPLTYSAKGSHANYATDGIHDHTIPHFNLPGHLFLVDETNDGHLWDPTLSAYFYKFKNDKFTPYDDKTPVNWLYYRGRWGDQQHPKDSPNQMTLFGNAKFAGGPTGPIDKGLDRKGVCPDGSSCWIMPFLAA